MEASLRGVLLPHAFMEMCQSMKGFLLELDKNGLEKPKNWGEGVEDGKVLGPVITGETFKKLTQMFNEGKACCTFMKWMENFKGIGLSDLLKEKLIISSSEYLKISLHYLRKEPLESGFYVWKVFCGMLLHGRDVNGGWHQAQEVL